MKLPILENTGNVVLPVVGKFIKGKMTYSGLAAIALGLVTDAASGNNIFDSLRSIISLVEQGIPHILVIFGGLATVAGFFRKAGWAAALQPTTIHNVEIK